MVEVRREVIVMALVVVGAGCESAQADVNDVKVAYARDVLARAGRRSSLVRVLGSSLVSMPAVVGE